MTKRIYWVDNFRGFVMLNTVLGWLLPYSFISSVSWVLDHPHSSAELDKMTFHDIGILAYVIIMGMMIRLSVHKRREKQTLIKSTTPLLKRYLFLMLFAFLYYGLPGSFSLADETNTNHIITGYIWNALFTLGTCGLIGSLVASLSAPLVIVLAFFIRGSFHYFETLPDLIGHSRFGGPFGAVFGFFPALLVSFILADLLIIKKPLSKSKTLLLLTGVGILFLLLSLLFHDPHSPTMIFNMRLVTLPYLLAASSVVIFVIVLFWSLHSLNNKPVFLLSSLGRNSLLIFLCLLIEQKVRWAADIPDEWPWALATMLFVFLFAIWLDKRQVRFRL